MSELHSWDCSCGCWDRWRYENGPRWRDITVTSTGEDGVERVVYHRENQENRERLISVIARDRAFEDHPWYCGCELCGRATTAGPGTGT
jgi:hypothetical protein